MKYLPLSFLAVAFLVAMPISAPGQEMTLSVPASVSEFAPVQAAEEARELGARLLSVPPLSVSLKGRPLLRLGSRSEDVMALRVALEERGFPVYVPVPPLAVSLDWPQPAHHSWEGGEAVPGVPTPTDLWVFDEHVVQAVRAAQLHYGLNEDGVAGPRLYESLEDSGQALGQDLMAWGDELDAMANQARSSGYLRMVVVNLPSYTLKAIDLQTGQTLVESRVIVGKSSSKTPVFTTNIINLKYNPDWTPPPSLAARGRRYTRPGPNNPMGRIRFSTDNHINIYLHHTNEPDLFARDNRALSAGCVRVEAWDSLAAFVANATVEHVHAQVDSGRTHFEKVESVPVVMSYSLADVVSGRPGRYPDVYGRRP